MLKLFTQMVKITIDLKLLVNTATEVEYLLNGGILQYVLKNIANS